MKITVTNGNNFVILYYFFRTIFSSVISNDCIYNNYTILSFQEDFPMVFVESDGKFIYMEEETHLRN